MSCNLKITTTLRVAQVIVVLRHQENSWNAKFRANLTEVEMTENIRTRSWQDLKKELDIWVSSREQHTCATQNVNVHERWKDSLLSQHVQIWNDANDFFSFTVYAA